MTDDIVTRLRMLTVNGYEMDEQEWVDLVPCFALLTAADEIERLRTALGLAVGELSTYGPMRYTSPEQLLEHFMQEARRG